MTSREKIEQAAREYRIKLIESGESYSSSKFSTISMMTDFACQIHDDLRAQLAAANQAHDTLLQTSTAAINRQIELTTQLEAALKEERAGLQDFANNYVCYCAYRYPGSTGYHGHDCESAVVREFVAQWFGPAPEAGK